MDFNNVIDKCYQFEKLAKDSNKYVYHLKSDDFKGKTIYSLNKIKDIDESIYKESIKKYKNRKDHLNNKINKLNCTWADVINLSMINPIKIFQLATLLGNKNHECNQGREILCIPIENLKNSECCIYDDNFSDKSEKAYSNFNYKKYNELEFIPSETAKYFAECVDKKEDPLMFAYIKHVLVKDEVSLINCKTIKFN